MHRDKPYGVLPKIKGDKLPYIYPQPVADIHTATLHNVESLAVSHNMIAEGKLQASISRSRMVIFEKAICNDWDMFVTLTVDQQKFDRWNLPAFYKSFSRYIRYLKEYYSIDVKYLFIPEQHENGAWHLHGLVSDLPLGECKLFSLDDKLPKYIRGKLQQGFNLYDWTGYHDRFGFSILEPVRNREACCKYILKYITKDLGRAVKETGAKVYYCSRNLKRAEVIATLESDEPIRLPEYKNLFCDRKSFWNITDAMNFSSVQYYESFMDAGIDEDALNRLFSS